MNVRANNNSQVFLMVFLFCIFIMGFDFKNKIEIGTIFLFLLILFINDYSVKDILIDSRKEWIVVLFSSIIILLFTFVSQNVYLEFETIDFDIASYLVVSQDIDKGNLPNEVQWESKGPLLFYIYYGLTFFTEKNLVFFKLLNDIIIFLISFILFLNIYKNTKKNLILSIIPPFLFLLLLSQPWGVNEYSEVFSLLFIGLAFYFYNLNNLKNKNSLLIGLLISFSTLINQGTVIFLIPYLIIIFRDRKELDTRYKLQNLLFGFSIPHFFFLSLYTFRGLFKVYKTTYFDIPLRYVESNLVSIGELIIFLRTYFDHLETIYFALIGLAFLIFLEIFKSFKLNMYYLNFFTALFFYYIGSNNYYHHLIFTLYFFVLLSSQIELKGRLVFVLTLVLISSAHFSITYGKKSINNFQNIEIISSSYPMNNLSKEIDSFFDNEYTILALDRVLILFYLDKQNETYIIHPTNHFEDYIVDTLENIGMVPGEHIDNILLYQSPDVIICFQRSIVGGEVKKHGEYNCALTDYRNEYIQIDTGQYKSNNNLDYYPDPYREINLYVLKSSINTEIKD